MIREIEAARLRKETARLKRKCPRERWNRVRGLVVLLSFHTFQIYSVQNRCGTRTEDDQWVQRQRSQQRQRTQLNHHQKAWSELAGPPWIQPWRPACRCLQFLLRVSENGSCMDCLWDREAKRIDSERGAEPSICSKQCWYDHV